MRFRYYLIVSVIAAFSWLSACNKSSTSSKNCDEYWIAKTQKEWLFLSSCSAEFKHYLGKGIYRNTVLYYTSISCVNCDAKPPQYGYTCKGDTVWVADWNEVTTTKILATCSNL